MFWYTYVIVMARCSRAHLCAYPCAPVMATSASGDTSRIAVRPAPEAPSNDSGAACSLRDLTEKGYGATDAALALLASDWDLNAAAALLERHAQTPDLLAQAADVLSQSANPAGAFQVEQHQGSAAHRRATGVKRESRINLRWPQQTVRAVGKGCADPLVFVHLPLR